MTNIQHVIDIDAPARAVWVVMRDLTAWPRWAPTFQEVKLARGPEGVGAVYAVRQPRLPPSRMEVTRWGPDGFTWEARSAVLGAQADHVIHATSTTACRVELAFRFTGVLAPLAHAMLAGLVRRYVTDEAAALRRTVGAQPRT